MAMIMLIIMLKWEIIVISLEKYRGSPQRDFNINIKFGHKIAILFHNLKKYDSHLIMEELDKFNLKISVKPNELEKCMGFTINNKLGFNDSFQFLSSSLARLFKTLNTNDVKYLSQEFDNNVLDLVKQKGFNRYEYMTDLEKYLPNKENFDSSFIKNYWQRIWTFS